MQVSFLEIFRYFYRYWCCCCRSIRVTSSHIQDVFPNFTHSSFVVSCKETVSQESPYVRAIDLLLFRPETRPFQRTSVNIDIKSRICRFFFLSHQPKIQLTYNVSEIVREIVSKSPCLRKISYFSEQASWQMDLFQLMRNHKCLPNHAVENRQAQLLVIDVVIRKYALVTVNENFDKFFNYFTLDG